MREEPTASPKRTTQEQEEEGNRDEIRTFERLDWLEKKVMMMEEVDRGLREEVKGLRDKLEETEWARAQLEKRVQEATWEAEIEGLRKEVEAGRVERESLRKEVEKGRKERENLRGEVERLGREFHSSPPGNRQSNTNEPGDERQSNTNEPRDDLTEPKRPTDTRAVNPPQRRKCVVLTDSNGRDVTADSIRNHMPRETRENYDIKVEVALRMEDAVYRVRKKLLDVSGCVVLIDNITNDVKGNWKHWPADPEETVRRGDLLRAALFAAGAETVLVSQIKPMQATTVFLK